MKRNQDQLNTLAEAARKGDQNAMTALIEEFRPLLRHMLRIDRAGARSDEREDLEAEGIVALLEYLTRGGDPIPAKVAVVLRSRVRRYRVRAVSLKEGQEIVLRVTRGALADAETRGEHLAGPALHAEVRRRCVEWSTRRGGDDAKIAERLVRRGIAAALPEIDGLLAASQELSLDAPACEDGMSLGETISSPTNNMGTPIEDFSDGLTLALAGLTTAERRAVLWVSGVEGDPETSRTAIAVACGLPVRALGKLLDQLAWSLRSPHHHYVATVDLTGQWEEAGFDPVSDVLALARRAR